MENELRRCWRDTTFRNSDNPTDTDRRYTALQKLALHYRRFSNIALLFIPMLPLSLGNVMRHMDAELNWMAIALILFGMVYFLTCSLMDRWLYRGISSIDVAEMPVVEVCRLAFHYRKKHLQFIAILIPFAVIFLGGMVSIFYTDIYLIWGLAIGAVLGLILGIHQFRIFMSEYRDITRD